MPAAALPSHTPVRTHERLPKPYCMLMTRFLSIKSPTFETFTALFGDQDKVNAKHFQRHVKASKVRAKYLKKDMVEFSEKCMLVTQDLETYFCNHSLKFCPSCATYCKEKNWILADKMFYGKSKPQQKPTTNKNKNIKVQATSITRKKTLRGTTGEEAIAAQKKASQKHYQSINLLLWYVVL